MNVIKAKYLNNDKPSGNAYVFWCPCDVVVGDKIIIRYHASDNTAQYGIVTEIGVDEEEILRWNDKARTVWGLAE